MPAQKRKYLIEVQRSMFSPSGHDVDGNFFAGLIDTIRYEGSRIVEFTGSTLTLECERPVIDRYHTFSIFPKMVN